MKAVDQQAISYLVNDRQLTKDAAVAIVAVLDAGESGLHTGPQPSTVTTDHGGVLFANGAFGIASWNGPRQKALKDFADKFKLDVNELETQLHFVLTESANNVEYASFWNALRSPASHYSDIITAMVNDYERPKDPASEVARAMAAAKVLYEETGSSLPAVPVTPPSAPASVVYGLSSTDLSLDLTTIVTFLESPTGAAILTALIKALILIPK
jgi:Phage tail lysozyme